MRYQETVFTRGCEVIQIPDGFTVTIPEGTPAVITQSLGDSFTLQVPTTGGLYRLAGKDADAIGQARPVAADPAEAGNGPLDEQRVWEALRTVYDPEIPINIVELGLVYSLCVEPIEGGGNRVLVTMTLTAPGCGMGQIIADEARYQIERIPGVKEARVDLVFDPPWNRDMMSEAARLHLGLM